MSSDAAPARSRRALLISFGLVAGLGFLADLLSKMLAVRHLRPGEPVRLLGDALTLRLIRNPGAAFSMGTNATVVLSVLAIVALGFCLVYVLPRVRTPWQAAVLGLASAGIAGNLTDRLFRAPGPLRGHVVDFFSVPHFAIFNVADILLTTAAGIVILWSLRDVLAERRAGTHAATARAED